MLYLDDRLPTHPKLFQAGKLLGVNGIAHALYLYLAGLAYAREHLTDGFVPDQFVIGNSLIREPKQVARALASRKVLLWHRVPGGYQIHDFLDYNPSASKTKALRAEWRKKKAAQRRGGNGQFHDLSRGDMAGTTVGTEKCPRETLTETRARAFHDPCTYSRSRDPGTSTACVLTGAARRHVRHHDENPKRRVA
jgi:hypothetical protein